MLEPETENGERARTALLGELALKGLEERLTESCTLKELPVEVRKVPALWAGTPRMTMVLLVVEEPLNTQRV